LAPVVRALHQLVQQVAYDLVAVGGHPHPLAEPDQVENDLCAKRRLPGARRTLYGEVTVLKARRQDQRNVLGSLTGLNERCSLNGTAETGRL